MELVERSILLANQAEALRPNINANESQKAATNQKKATLAEALSKAKEAFSLDRTLHRFRDHHGENIFHNFDLTYTVTTILIKSRTFLFKINFNFNDFLKF